jgi:uncharacterized protein YeaO (DUF488 family)
MKWSWLPGLPGSQKLSKIKHGGAETQKKERLRMTHEDEVPMPVATKRAYDSPSADDGYRVLVDGLWPRGVTKEKLRLAEWMREIAPTAQLRKWYGHQPERWEEFRRRYRKELAEPGRRALVQKLVAHARQKKVTLVFGARDAERCNAAVIADMIREQLSTTRHS